MLEDDRHIVTLKVHELQEAIQEAVRVEVRTQIKLILEEAKREDKLTGKLIPRKEVAKLFNISLVSLDKWRRKGLLPKPVKQGSRVYYKKDEIMELINNRGNNSKIYNYE